MLAAIELEDIELHDAVDRGDSVWPGQKIGEIPDLSELEAKLYDLVVKRFLAVFYPPAEYLLTTRITRVAAEPFKTEGKVLVSPGWLAVYGKEAASESEPILAKVLPNPD